jgi:L-ascorbate metabolism protein UlaG (beta-lactamase superfamily)
MSVATGLPKAGSAGRRADPSCQFRRLLTDPTFDPPGTVYRTAAYELRKTIGPALPAEAVQPVDVVLLSHDHHFDNLDNAGRVFLARAARVLTTVQGAGRLGGDAVGLTPWQSTSIPANDGHVLRVTATPARHGPPHADRGPVVGFALTFADEPSDLLYLSGDTVWYEGVREVSERLAVRTAALFMGAARIRAVGGWHLTFTAHEAVQAARAFAGATIVPLHYEGWEHLSESRADVERAFQEAGLQHRLRWLTAGVHEAVVE